MTKPTTVNTPTGLPACSYASGIIEVASIVRTAPPENANTKEMTPVDAPSRST